MPNSGFIYALTDPREPDAFLAVRYIGLTKYSLRHRLIVHLSEARKGNQTHRAKWIRVLLSEGVEPSIIELESPSIELLAEREIATIADYRSRGANLTNGTSGGDGVRDLSEEAYERLCFAARNRSAETRERIRQSRLGHPVSDETRQKIALAWTRYSDETRAKILESGRAKRIGNKASVGRIVSAESRLKMSQAHTGHHRGIGRKATEEARRNMSEAHKKKTIPPHQERLF